MSYKISYDSNNKKYFYISDHQQGKKKKSVGVFLAVAILMILLIGITITKENRQLANKALSVFTEDIEKGESLVDAITVFCRDIIESARNVE